MRSITIVLALCGVFLLADHTLGQIYSTDGDGGDTCGPMDRKCLMDKADCDPVLDKCVCRDPPYVHGDGYINCYKNNTFHAEVSNDPNVKTYNGLTIPLPLPCRYLLTHTRTHLKDKTRTRVGYCEFQTYVFHHKARGKFYVGGFDTAIRLTYDNSTVEEMSIRKYGKAYNGSYSYTVNGTDGDFLPNGAWEDDVIDYYDSRTNLRIKCDIDEINNLAILYAKKCGVRIQFRPYDCKLRLQQPFIPHVAYGLNCAFHPEFLSTDKVVAMSPTSEHNGIGIDDVVMPGLTREQKLIVRALNSMADQNAPQANPVCADSAGKLSNCDATELEQAMNNCLFLLKLPKFIRCVDSTDTGVIIMGLFNQCIDVYCDGSDCTDFKTDLASYNCHSPFPDVVDFLTSTTNCP